MRSQNFLWALPYRKFHLNFSQKYVILYQVKVQARRWQYDSSAAADLSFGGGERELFQNGGGDVPLSHGGDEANRRAGGAARRYIVFPHQPWSCAHRGGQECSGRREIPCGLHKARGGKGAGARPPGKSAFHPHRYLSHDAGKIHS